MLTVFSNMAYNFPNTPSDLEKAIGTSGHRHIFSPADQDGQNLQPTSNSIFSSYQISPTAPAKRQLTLQPAPKPLVNHIASAAFGEKPSQYSPQILKQWLNIWEKK